MRENEEKKTQYSNMHLFQKKMWISSIASKSSVNDVIITNALEYAIERTTIENKKHQNENGKRKQAKTGQKLKENPNLNKE